MFAFAESYTEASVLYAEMHALVIGLEMCWARGLTSVHVESDSNLLVQMLNGRMCDLIKLRHFIRRIR